MIPNLGYRIKYRFNVLKARFIIRKSDKKHHWPTNSTLPENEKVFHDLKTQGFAKVSWLSDSIIKSGLIDSVREVYKNHHPEPPNVIGLNIKHPFLFHPICLKLLGDIRLNSIVKDYLGENANFDMCQIVRLPETADFFTDNSYWHHDRVGRRLKIFIYLSDVGPEDRATHYASGSNTRGFRGYSNAASRRSDEFIRNRFDIKPLTGKAGEAYLFDTNGYHQAKTDANRKNRDILYYEWSDFNKTLFFQDKPEYHIGIQEELFPLGFNPDHTLIKTERLEAGDEYTRYKGTTEPFYFIHDPTQNSFSSK